MLFFKKRASIPRPIRPEKQRIYKLSHPQNKKIRNKIRNKKGQAV
jgi:hypothetical protein